MMAERLANLGERISLKVEGPLWQAVCDYPGAEEILNNRPRGLLVGTDRNLSLTSEILKTYPQARITVVEKDQAVVEKARRWIGEGGAVKIIQGEFPHPSLLEEKYSLVIAKNLIHFLSEEELKNFVDGVGKVLSPQGLFFASTPPIFGSKPWHEVRELGILPEQRRIKGFLGGTLFIFKDLNRE